MPPPKKSLNRPKKRTLVRWDENLNELLLLTVQSVCNTHSVKIPWMEVAKTMGNNVTEGAIVQHLAKLRSRRAGAGKDVPPPLRRGGLGAAITPTKASTGSKRKARKSPLGESDDEPSVPFECDDTSSDEDYTEKTRPKRKPKKTKKRASSLIKKESDSEQNNHEEDITGSEEMLVPGATFLDFQNTDESEDSSTESSGSPAPQSKVVVLRYRQQSTNNQELDVRGPEASGPPLVEAGAHTGFLGNMGHEQTLGFGINAHNQPANLGLPPPDFLMLQPFENVPQGSYIPHDSVPYGNPLGNHGELQVGMRMYPDPLLGENTSFFFHDYLGPEGSMDFS